MTLFSYFQGVCLHLIYSLYAYKCAHKSCKYSHGVLKTTIKMRGNTCVSETEKVTIQFSEHQNIQDHKRQISDLATV